MKNNSKESSVKKKKDISKEIKPTVKMYIAMAALAVIATTAIVAGISYADTEEWPGSRGERGKAVLEAIENNDYSAWTEAIGNGPMADNITEENFSKIVEMHNLMTDGKIEEAQAIADELGLKRGEFERGMRGGRYGGEGCFMGMNEEARNALDNNDYSAWAEAVAGTPIADKINENNFSKLVESHKLMQEGQSKFEEARAIREELGLEPQRGERGEGLMGGGMMMHGSLK